MSFLVLALSLVLRESFQHVPHPGEQSPRLCGPPFQLEVVALVPDVVQAVSQYINVASFPPMWQPQLICFDLRNG